MAKVDRRFFRSKKKQRRRRKRKCQKKNAMTLNFIPKLLFIVFYRKLKWPLLISIICKFWLNVFNLHFKWECKRNFVVMLLSIWLLKGQIHTINLLTKLYVMATYECVRFQIQKLIPNFIGLTKNTWWYIFFLSFQ